MNFINIILRNIYINEKYVPDTSKTYFKRILLYGLETWTTTKREDSKIHVIKFRFLRSILNRIKKDGVRSTNVRSQLGVNEIQNVIRNSRITWFGPVMRIIQEKIPEKNGGKMIDTKIQNQLDRLCDRGYRCREESIG